MKIAQFFYNFRASFPHAMTVVGATTDKDCTVIYCGSGTSDKETPLLHSYTVTPTRAVCNGSRILEW